MAMQTRWRVRSTRALSISVAQVMELPRAVATARESADARAQRSVFL
jgi:hypothetical protein